MSESFLYKFNKLNYMVVVALKNVRKEVWQRFKSESARQGLKMGEFFERLVEKHAHAEIKSAVWEKIFRGKPLLSEAEARELRSAIGKFRRGFVFRDV